MRHPLLESLFLLTYRCYPRGDACLWLSTMRLWLSFVVVLVVVVAGNLVSGRHVVSGGQWENPAEPFRDTVRNTLWALNAGPNLTPAPLTPALI